MSYVLMIGIGNKVYKAFTCCLCNSPTDSTLRGTFLSDQQANKIGVGIRVENMHVLLMDYYSLGVRIINAAWESCYVS